MINKPGAMKDGVPITVEARGFTPAVKAMLFDIPKSAMCNVPTSAPFIRMSRLEHCGSVDVAKNKKTFKSLCATPLL